MAESPPAFRTDADGGERLRFGGSTLIVRASGETTGGAFAVLEEVPPLLDTPNHVHANEDEMFYVLEGDPQALVGWGGFKGAPADGLVEVGYEIAESRRGQGLATAATEAMVAEAFRDENITAVIAHTLPERNASVRVLEKAGFAHDGEAEEGGTPVWRHRRDRPTGA